MLKYSELSKSQKVVVDTLRQGGKLYHSSNDKKYHLIHDKGFSIRVAQSTINSLELRHYLQFNYNIADRTWYKLNPEIK